MEWENRIVLTIVGLRNGDEYNQEFSAYIKIDVIRQKWVGIYQKYAEKLDFSIIFWSIVLIICVLINRL